MFFTERNKETACYFSINGTCTAITERCDGTKQDCKFRKTEQEYIDGRDASIDRCRKLGLCETCKYVDKRCKKSIEEMVEIDGTWQFV